MARIPIEWLPIFIIIVLILWAWDRMEKDDKKPRKMQKERLYHQQTFQRSSKPKVVLDEIHPRSKTGDSIPTPEEQTTAADKLKCPRCGLEYSQAEDGLACPFCRKI